MSLVDQYTDRLQADLANGRTLGEAMRDLAITHAEHLSSLTPVQVLALEPEACPRCGGRLITGDTVAKCAAGCDWTSPR